MEKALKKLINNVDSHYGHLSVSLSFRLADMKDYTDILFEMRYDRSSPTQKRRDSINLHVISSMTLKYTKEGVSFHSSYSRMDDIMKDGSHNTKHYSNSLSGPNKELKIPKDLALHLRKNTLKDILDHFEYFFEK